MQTLKRRTKLVVAIGMLLIGCLLVLVVVTKFVKAEETPVQPERALPLPSSLAPTPEPQPAVVTKTPEPLPQIKPGPITSIRIPAIGVNAKASGAIMPTKSARCKDSKQCMDPPQLDQIAWSDGFGLPAYPSKDAVLVYGHSNSTSKDAQVFNNLGALAPNDSIVLQTTKGRFTYQVEKVEQIPFADIAWRKSLYTHTLGELRLFTCNLSGGGYDKAAVVIARLIKAKPL